jgi:peptide subunit release factor 1 (eRF1)
MISTNDIQRLIQRENSGRKVMSVYLDMSVNSDNKRTHSIFLTKEKARFAELESDRENHHREPLGAAFSRVESWLEESYDPANRGVAIFADVGGDRFDVFQFPAPLPNRLEVSSYPIIGPLTELVHTHPRYGIIVVDREHLRLLELYMATVGEDYSLEPDAIPTAHDVQAGGYSQKDYQKRKAEETRHFFRDFGEEVDRFQRRIRADHYVLLGTTENTQRFREYLPKPVAELIIHAAHAPVAATGTDLVRHLTPVLEEIGQRQTAASLNAVRDRIRQSHFATTGLADTLIQLQEGKVERLLVSRDLDSNGVQCTQCGFYLEPSEGDCPYCGGTLREGVDLVESMIRIAANQAVGVDFVASDTMREYSGVAALLKF